MKSGIKPGGHDRKKLYSAYAKAQNATKPVVILAHQVKGYKIPEAESKKIPLTNLKKCLTKALKVSVTSLNYH